MSFKQTLIRFASKHPSSYSTPLERFLTLHPPPKKVTLPLSKNAQKRAAKRAALFEPHQSYTSSWISPKFSLRRQAVLAKQAALTGQLSSLPDSPKTCRISQRLHRLATTQAFEQESVQYQYIPKPNGRKVEVEGVKPTVLGERVTKPNQRVSEKEKNAAIQVARLQVKDVGPYAGRAKVFKGSKVDKDKQRRQADVEAKLKGMSESVKDWQEGFKEQRNKLKPGLPF